MIEDAFSKLICCERCDHGATLHASDGCTVFRCTCACTKHDVVESNIDCAQIEARARYRRSA